MRCDEQWTSLTTTHWSHYHPLVSLPTSQRCARFRDFRRKTKKSVSLVKPKGQRGGRQLTLNPSCLNPALKPSCLNPTLNLRICSTAHSRGRK